MTLVQDTTEECRSLRTLSLIYWNRGEVEASEVVLNRARRLERKAREEQSRIR